MSLDGPRANNEVKMKALRAIVLVVGVGLLLLSGVAGSIMAGLVGTPGERALALLAAAVAGLGLVQASSVTFHTAS